MGHWTERLKFLADWAKDEASEWAAEPTDPSEILDILGILVFALSATPDSERFYALQDWKEKVEQRGMPSDSMHTVLITSLLSEIHQYRYEILDDLDAAEHRMRHRLQVKKGGSDAQ